MECLEEMRSGLRYFTLKVGVLDVEHIGLIGNHGSLRMLDLSFSRFDSDDGIVERMDDLNPFENLETLRLSAPANELTIFLAGFPAPELTFVELNITSTAGLAELKTQLSTGGSFYTALQTLLKLSSPPRITLDLDPTVRESTDMAPVLDDLRRTLAGIEHLWYNEGEGSDEGEDPREDEVGSDEAEDGDGDEEEEDEDEEEEDDAESDDDAGPSHLTAYRQLVYAYSSLGVTITRLGANGNIETIVGLSKGLEDFLEKYS